MSGFIYFLPRREILTPDTIRRLGLGYAFDGSPTVRDVMSGPGGSAGMLFADFTNGRIAYKADQQHWRRIPGKEVHVGYWNDDKPTPATLVRKSILPGKDVVLADGNHWHVPIIRDQAVNNTLPQFLDQDEDGNWISDGMTLEHEKLWNLTGDFFQTFLTALDASEDSDEVTVSVAELSDNACEILAANYRVSRIEVACLHLFDSLSAGQILKVACDYDGFVKLLAEMDKKKDSLVGV